MRQLNLPRPIHQAFTTPFAFFAFVTPFIIVYIPLDIYCSIDKLDDNLTQAKCML